MGGWFFLIQNIDPMGVFFLMYGHFDGDDELWNDKRSSTRWPKWIDKKNGRFGRHLMGCLGNSWQTRCLFNATATLGWSSLVMFWWTAYAPSPAVTPRSRWCLTRLQLLSDLIHHSPPAIGKGTSPCPETWDEVIPLGRRSHPWQHGNKADEDPSIQRRLGLRSLQGDLRSSRPRQQKKKRRPLRMNQRVQCAPKCLRNKGFSSPKDSDQTVLVDGFDNHFLRWGPWSFMLWAFLGVKICYGEMTSSD